MNVSRLPSLRGAGYWRLFGAYGVTRQRTETPARPWHVVRQLQGLLVRHALMGERGASGAQLREYLFFWCS